jgi:hypothetical protein
MQCQEEDLPGQILEKHVMQCWSRHQQLLQSLPVNFCGPMVYPHKLVDIGGSWFQPHCDFDWFSTSTCDMESVSRGNLSSKQRLPRLMSTQGRGWIPGAPHYPLVVSGCQYLLEFCWNSVGDSDWWFSLILPFPHFPRDFDGFPKISRRSPEVGHAVFPDGTQIKQRALLVEFGDCALKVWVYKFIWVITCYNVFINPL